MIKRRKPVLRSPRHVLSVVSSHDAKRTVSMDAEVEQERQLEMLMHGGQREVRDHLETVVSTCWDRALTTGLADTPCEARPSKLSEVRDELQEMQRKHGKRAGMAVAGEMRMRRAAR